MSSDGCLSAEAIDRIEDDVRDALADGASEAPPSILTDLTEVIRILSNARQELEDQEAGNEPNGDLAGDLED